MSRTVARHLVAVAALLDVDPELAWRHAVAARRRGARLHVVREAAGLAAYRSGRYAEALSELRTARRMSGSSIHLPLMADSERGLGRPDRALELARSPEGSRLDRAGRTELLIVAAGARSDLGQLDAAVAMLQVPELRATGTAPWLARLRYAYAEALTAVGRHAEAAEWREQATTADPEGIADLGDDDGEGQGDSDMVVDLLDDDDEDDATDVRRPS